MNLVKERLGTVGGYMTLQVAAELKGCSADNLRHWLRAHDIKTDRVGRVILVRLSDLESYQPREKRTIKGYDV